MKELVEEKIDTPIINLVTSVTSIEHVCPKSHIAF
jgi:hypothetical protein